MLRLVPKLRGMSHSIDLLLFTKSLITGLAEKLCSWMLHVRQDGCAEQLNPCWSPPQCWESHVKLCFLPNGIHYGQKATADPQPHMGSAYPGSGVLHKPMAVGCAVGDRQPVVGAEQTWTPGSALTEAETAGRVLFPHPNIGRFLGDNLLCSSRRG